MTDPVLRVSGLQTYFETREGVLRAVDDVSFEVGRGEIVGLVGESGSGKSVIGFSIIGLIDSPGRIVGGSIQFAGEDLTRLDEARLRDIRGNRLSMIFQDPMMTLNPVLRIDTQMFEAIAAHRRVSQDEKRKLAVAALQQVGISSPESRLKAYPHEFSGGMRQRIAIAIALLNKPDLIIADEPTTALDVTIQAQVLSEVQSLCAEVGSALIWITHDLAIVAGLADRIIVQYAGRIVEQGPVDDILDDPRHPYTRGLLDSVPGNQARHGRLWQIPGMMPSPLDLPEGCAFASRCPRAAELCKTRPESTRAENGREYFCHFPYGVET